MGHFTIFMTCRKDEFTDNLCYYHVTNARTYIDELENRSITYINYVPMATNKLTVSKRLPSPLIDKIKRSP